MQIFSDEVLAQYGLVYEAEDPNVLKHYGVTGQKWGIRKLRAKPGDGIINTGRLSKAKSLLIGVYGNKSKYTDPHALQIRKNAGKLRIAAIGTGLLASVTGIVGSSTQNTGAQALANVLNSVASTTGLAANVAGTIAVSDQQQADLINGKRN